MEAETTNNEAVPEQTAPLATVDHEPGELSPDEAKALWAAEIEKYKKEGIQADEEAAPDADTRVEEVAQEIAPPEKDGAESVEEEAPKELSAVEKKLLEIEERNARLEAELAALKQKPTGEKAPEPKVEDDLPPESKELLDYTPGLDKLIEARARKIAREFFEEQEKKKVAEVSKETEATHETKFWGELGTWFKQLNPEQSLDQVRQSAKFKDWLKVHENETNELMAKAKDRYDTSGAKAVFQRYLQDVNPGIKQTPKTPGTDKRMAAARTPASLSSRAQRGDASEDNIWENEVKRLTSSERSSRRVL